MGTYKKGILGAFSGTVGPIVGASFRGKDVIRSRPKKSSKPATEPQLMQRAKFAKAIQFLTPANAIISDYYGTPSGSKSRFNMAMSYHITEAINYVADVAVVDYTKVVYTKGNLLNAQNLIGQAAAGALLELTWTNNSGQGEAKATDLLMVVVVEADTNNYEFYLNVDTRDSAGNNISLPAYLTGAAVHVYAFMASADGKINSTSQHLGMFTVL